MTNCLFIPPPPPVLTRQHLKDFRPHRIFAVGEIVDGPNGANMANTGKMMRWVAVRGEVDDWAIYCQNPYYINSTDPEVLAADYGGVWDWIKIRSHGDKMGSRENIQKCVPCDDEAMARYRF